MVPLLLLLVFLVQYAVIYRKGRHRWQLREKRQSNTVEDNLNQPEEVRLGRGKGVGSQTLLPSQVG